MKTQRIAVCTLLVVASSLAGAQTDLPKRKAGQWEMKMEMSNVPGRVITTEQCIDDKTDAELQKRALEMKGQNSCQNSSRKTASGYEFDSSCKMGETTITSHAVMSGDFSSAYQIKTHATYTPALMGMTQSDMTINVRYEGACSAGMNPGDISMNGVKLGSMGGQGGQAKMTPEQMKQMMEAMQKASQK